MAKNIRQTKHQKTTIEISNDVKQLAVILADMRDKLDEANKKLSRITKRESALLATVIATVCLSATALFSGLKTQNKAYAMEKGFDRGTSSAIAEAKGLQQVFVELGKEAPVTATASDKYSDRSDFHYNTRTSSNTNAGSQLERGDTTTQSSQYVGQNMSSAPEEELITATSTVAQEEMNDLVNRAIQRVKDGKGDKYDRETAEWAERIGYPSIIKQEPGISSSQRSSDLNPEDDIRISAGDIGEAVGEGETEKLGKTAMSAADIVASEEIDQLSKGSGRYHMFVGHNGPNPAKLQVKGDKIVSLSDGKIVTLTRGNDTLTEILLRDGGYMYNIDQADGMHIYYNFDKTGTMISRGWRTGESDSGNETISDMADTLRTGRLAYDQDGMNAIHFHSSSFPEVTDFFNTNFGETLSSACDQKSQQKTPAKRGSLLILGKKAKQVGE